MKSNKRVDEEIEAVAQFWNLRDDHNVRSVANQLCSAVYHALRWSRGCRAVSPVDSLRARIAKILEDSK